MRNSSIRGWMLSLTLPAIVAGSARAQSPPKATETKVPTVERRMQGEAPKQSSQPFDPYDPKGAKNLRKYVVPYDPKPNNFRPDEANDLRVVENLNWADPLQPFVRWPNQNPPVNEDIGAELTPVDAALRAQLNLPQGQGLVVTNVVQNGRAARVGLKPNDILLTLGGTSLTQPIDFLNVLKAQTTGTRGNESIELAYLRGGKPASVKIKADIRVALAAAAEEKPNYYIGVPSNPLDETFRAHLDVPAGTGLVVGEISEGTPAAKAGVKLGDILLAFAGQPLPDEDSLRAKIQATGPQPAKLDVLRAGKPMALTITPEARKAEASVYWTANTDFATTRLDFAATRLNDVIQSQQNPGVLFLNSPQPAPADLSKKIDDLTAQVQALAKAIEGLKAAQGEKK